jgi:DNA polymerase-3 subunit delta
VRHFGQLWKVRELEVKNRPVKEIAKVAGVPFFVVDSLIQQGKKFSRLDFIRAHELFLETDLAMKSSGADAAALLENLILNLVKKRAQ